MSLKDKIIKSEYRSLIDNVVQDFYIPLLHESTSYKRAVGFFSSSALVEISKGIADMAKDGGKIEIVASPYLSDDDIQAIKEGYENRQKIIEGALIRQLSDEHEDYYSMERLNLLAHLISDGILDIRIAYTDKDNEIGMYHEKMGILEDKDGNHVAFSGSMNESMTAMSINYETIDVFCDWREAEADRVKLKENAFYSMWNNVEPSLKVLEFPNISDVLIEKYRNKDPNFDSDDDAKLLSSEPYPLVMDAPLSAFDKRRIKTVCEALPETAEQVIIFIKDTDGELAEDYMGNRIGSRHQFDKKNEFETNLV